MAGFKTSCYVYVLSLGTGKFYSYWAIAKLLAIRLEISTTQMPFIRIAKFFQLRVVQHTRL